MNTNNRRQRTRSLSVIGVVVLVGVSLLAGCGNGERAPAEPQFDVDPPAVDSSVEPFTAPVHYVFGDSGASGVLPGSRLSVSVFESGERIWAPSSHAVSMISDGEHLYVVDGFPAVSAIDLDGQQIWRRELDAPVLAAPVIFDGRLILTDTIGTVQLISTEDGHSVQSIGSEGSIFRSPLMVNNELFVADTTGSIRGYQFDAHRQRLERRREITGAGDPVVFLADSSFLLSVGRDGEVRAYGYRSSSDVRTDATAAVSNEFEQTPHVFHSSLDHIETAALRNGVLYLGGSGFEVWDVRRGESAQTTLRTGELGQIVLSEQGPLLLDLYGTVHVLDAVSLEVIRDVPIEGEPTFAVIQDRTFYTGLHDGTVQLRDARDGSDIWATVDGNSPVHGMVSLNNSIYVLHAAEGLRRYRGISEDADVVAQDTDLELREGHNELRIEESGMQVGFRPQDGGRYELMAIGSQSEELLIIVYDAQGRELGRNVGYQVDSRLEIELSSGREYTIHLEPVLRGTVGVEAYVEITKR